jgi:hypothetical protein
LPFEEAQWKALYLPFTLAVWLLLPLAILLVSLTNHLVLAVKRPEGKSNLVDSLFHTLSTLLINKTSMEEKLADLLASRVRLLCVVISSYTG